MSADRAATLHRTDGDKKRALAWCCRCKPETRQDEAFTQITVVNPEKRKGSLDTVTIKDGLADKAPSARAKATSRTRRRRRPCRFICGGGVRQVTQAKAPVVRQHDSTTLGGVKGSDEAHASSPLLNGTPLVQRSLTAPSDRLTSRRLSVLTSSVNLLPSIHEDGSHTAADAEAAVITGDDYDAAVLAAGYQSSRKSPLSAEAAGSYCKQLSFSQKPSYPSHLPPTSSPDTTIPSDSTYRKSSFGRSYGTTTAQRTPHSTTSGITRVPSSHPEVDLPRYSSPELELSPGSAAYRGRATVEKPLVSGKVESGGLGERFTPEDEANHSPRPDSATVNRDFVTPGPDGGLSSMLPNRTHSPSAREPSESWHTAQATPARSGALTPVADTLRRSSGRQAPASRDLRRSPVTAVIEAAHDAADFWPPAPTLECFSQIQTLEDLLDEVLNLVIAEYPLQANEKFELLLNKVDDLLFDSDLDVVGLVKTPNSLAGLYERPGGRVPMLSAKSGGVGTPAEQLCAQKSIEFAQVWSKTAFGGAPVDHNALPETKPKNNSASRSRSFASANPLGIGVLAETFAVFPLMSQGAVAGTRSMSVDKLEVDEANLRKILDSGVGEYMGRTLLQRLVWPLGQMPCMVYTVSNPAADHGASPNIQDNVRKMSRILTGSPVVPEGSIHLQRSVENKNRYLYTRRAVQGATLPVDIQVMFVKKTEKAGQAGRLRKYGHGNAAEKVNSKQTWMFYRWLLEFLEGVINNAQIHRLRLEMYGAKKAFTVLKAGAIQDKTWQQIKTKDYHLTWKLQDDGNALCIIDGQMTAPLFECLSLFYESDLHKNWIPFLSESGKIHEVSAFAHILRQKSNLPWPLDDRESVMLGYAIDGLALDEPCVVVNGTSVPDQATSLFGVELTPPRPGLTRLHIQFFTLCLYPNKARSDTSSAKLVVFMDPQMNFIPKAVQGFIARQSAARLFLNIQKLTTTFANSIYAKRVAANPRIYRTMKERVDRFYGKK